MWGTNHGGFPIPQFDQFDGLDSAWCTEAGLEALHSHWEAHVAGVDGWGTLEVEDLLDIAD